MVWHIFKKDWKLLWGLVVGVAAVQFASVAVLLRLGLFRENRALASLDDLFQAMVFLGIAFLIAAAVHQDALPGVRQDWLVRPVKRRDLLLSKLLFVSVMVHGPMLAADLLEGLADGFSLHQSLAAAVSRSVYVLIGFSLPIFAFASLTRNMMEAVVGGVAAFLGFVGFLMLTSTLTGGSPGQAFPTFWTGVVWVSESAKLALILLGASAVLSMQYFRRKTTSARCLTVGVALVCLLTYFIPWRPAFAIQQRLSPTPGAASPILMAFESSLGKYRRPSGLNLDDAKGRRRIRRDEDDMALYLPLRITGLPADAVLKADKSEVLLIGPDGKTERLAPGDDLEIRKEGPSDGEKRIHHGIHVRSDLYDRIKDQSVRLEINYSLTLFRLAGSYGMPALDGDQRVPTFGWCGTKTNQAGTAIWFRCLVAGKPPSCATFFLEHVPSGRRNPERSFTSADYAPYFGQYVPDAMSRGGVNLPFRDETGLARYPVDGPQLPESRVVVRVYQPQDHFTRRLVIPEIRMKDWEAQ